MWSIMGVYSLRVQNRETTKDNKFKHSGYICHKWSNITTSLTETVMLVKPINRDGLSTETNNNAAF
jgi:hypothetical protein